MAMTVMKPQLVVDHRGKERDLEELTLAKAGNDVRAYLTKIQEKRNKIDQLRKDNSKFDDQRWLTLTFEEHPVLTSSSKVSVNHLWSSNLALSLRSGSILLGFS